MFRLPSIILPVDFSGPSKGAAHYAKALTCRFQSELHLVHVIDLRAYGMLGPALDEFMAAEQRASRKTETEQQLESFLAGELRGLKVKRAVLYGDAAQEIVRYADAENASLIVLPTHGYGPFRRFLLGSVTAKVLHDADCPVWTGVHLEGAPVAESVSFDRILCAMDPGKADHSALAWAWQFAQEVGGAVRIVHSIPGASTEHPEYFNGKLREYLERRAKDEIAKAQEDVGSKAEVCIVAGPVANAVRAAAMEWDAHLLVIGRGVASGFLGRLRTESYAILRESPCPVVSI
jgi:nucleotide-binding universal stress UspA family protein